LEPAPDHTGEGKRCSFLASEGAAVESKFFPLRIKTASGTADFLLA